MRRSNLTVGLYLLLVFLSGGAVGFFGHLLYRPVTARTATVSKPTPEELRQKRLLEMKTRLSLSDDQLRQLNSIYDGTRQEFTEKIRPQMKVIQEQQVGKIRVILTDVQRAEYEKMLQEAEKKRQQSKGPGC
jgi:transposase